MIDLIIFNNFTGHEKSFVNTVLLIIKQFIYSAKCLNSNLHVSQIIPRIIEIYKIEKYVAIRQDELRKHEKKWKIFTAWLYPNVQDC